MDALTLSLLLFILGLLTGSLFFLVYSRFTLAKREQSLKNATNLILNRAKSQASKIERQAKETIKEWEEQAHKKVEQEIKQEQNRIKNKELKLTKEEQNLKIERERKQDDFNRKELELKKEKEIVDSSQKQLAVLKEKLEREKVESEKIIEKSALMTKEEAQKELKNLFKEEVKNEIAEELIQIKEDMQKDHEDKAKILLAQVMTRYSAEVTAEQTVETLPILDSFSKGKIIGREGRNIKALEASCGVDLLIEEGQEIISISCFDPVRRTIAKRSIQKLMEEGRVHPAFIEKMVEKVKKEILSEAQDEGKKTCFDLDLYDINPEIMKVLGTLKYRFIEGQNLLKNAQEITHIASLLAEELDANKKQVSRAALLHNIGLGIPHFIEGSYSVAGSQFCKKYGESHEICDAIARHEGKKDPKSLLDYIIQTAYSMSHSRFVAKKTLLENYIKRLKDLESLANSFDGVKNSYVLQAGKEIRVLVDTLKVVDDKQMAMLGWDIAKKIRQEKKGTGNIKINIIREYKIIEHAR